MDVIIALIKSEELINNIKKSISLSQVGIEFISDIENFSYSKNKYNIKLFLFDQMMLDTLSEKDIQKLTFDEHFENINSILFYYKASFSFYEKAFELGICEYINYEFGSDFFNVLINNSLNRSINIASDVNDLCFIVSKDKSFRKIINYYLRKNGFNIKLFENTQQLIYESQNVLPTIIIMEGDEEIDNKKLSRNKRLASIPVICAIDKEKKYTIYESSGLDFFDIIIKPFSEKELIFKIHNVIKYSNFLTESEENPVYTPFLGLYDKKNILHLLEKEIARERRYKNQFSVMLIYFEKHNDLKREFGEKYAEIVLLDCAKKILQDIRKEDFIGRYKENNLLLFFPLNDRYRTFLLAERLRKKMSDTIFRIPGNKISISVSIGISDNQTSTETEEILKDCQKAIDTALKKGGNLCVIYKNKKKKDEIQNNQ